MDNKKIDAATITDQSEVIRLLQLDSKPWYQKPNLRALYFCLIPAALGVEMTTGYDGSVLNGLQAVSHWQDCKQYTNCCKSRIVLTQRLQISDILLVRDWGF